jgi:YD repeat-containing protein
VISDAIRLVAAIKFETNSVETERIMALGIRLKTFIAVGGALVILGGVAGQAATAEPRSQQQQAVRQATDDMRAVDVEVTSQGFPFSLTRFYHWAPEAPSGLLGKGWRLTLESRLVLASNTVTLDDADGTDVVFTRQADGSYTTPQGAPYTLKAVTGAGYSLTAQDGTSRTFNTTGRLTGMVNAAGKGLRLTYTSTGRIASVTDAEGRTAAFATDSLGRLIYVTLADGKRVTYVYTSQSYLSAVAAVDGSKRTYTYDAQGRLIT